MILVELLIMEIFIRNDARKSTLLTQLYHWSVVIAVAVAISTACNDLINIQYWIKYESMNTTFVLRIKDFQSRRVVLLYTDVDNFSFSITF